MNPSRKRRLDGANETLLKPFVSPLRASPQSNAPQRRRESQTSRLSSTTLQSASPLACDQQQKAAISLTTDAASPKVPSTPARTGPARTTSSSVRRTLTHTQQQVKAVRRDIDVLEQAVDISTSKSAETLDRLTLKWRNAAQQAADMLFEDAKDRVDMSGGFHAWKSATRGSNFSTFDSQDDIDYEILMTRHRPAGDPGNRAEDELDEAADTEASNNDEAHESGLASAGENDNDGVEESFTMAAMLQALGIDLDVIGYDSEAQCWLAAESVA